MQLPLFTDPAKKETLEEIYEEILQKGRLLFPNRIFIFGDGEPSSGIVFIGESPGPPDLESGKPFRGPVGELLDKILGSIELDRKSCYLTNVIKFICEGEEITHEMLKFFTPFLLREISALSPRLIVTLGNTPTRVLLNTKQRISLLRGRFYEFYGAKLLPTYNPAYLMRDASKKREVWEDMKKIKAFLQS
ncbi:MAG: uracil-DNA glycosylase [Acidobacteriota bacterium]|nr:uracil-DNA glycosylase [Pyrinomonadaceae bacterium]MDW8304688.1 uracil-DNA glycosylase [Acidobacteriota bacterium]